MSDATQGKPMTSLRLRYSKAVAIIHAIDIDADTRVIVFGDPENGGYEWGIERKGKVEQHSDVGYGNVPAALRDGLMTAWPPMDDGLTPHAVSSETEPTAELAAALAECDYLLRNLHLEASERWRLEHIRKVLNWPSNDESRATVGAATADDGVRDYEAAGRFLRQKAEQFERENRPHDKKQPLPASAFRLLSESQRYALYAEAVRDAARFSDAWDASFKQAMENGQRALSATRESVIEECAKVCDQEHQRLTVAPLLRNMAFVASDLAVLLRALKSSRYVGDGS